MLFHSPEFIFLFLPISVWGFFLAQRWHSRSAAMVWLSVVSLCFYGWWNPAYLWLLGFSIIFNYCIAHVLRPSAKARKAILVFGIVVNLLLLAYFKYANFFIDTVNIVTSTSYTLSPILLPLGISFFTFEQIAWLLETYHRKITRVSFLAYCTFITNFPKFIAGPIIRPHEYLPQLHSDNARKFRMDFLSVGITIFIIGLFKKVVLADAMAPFVGPVFHASALHEPVTFMEAWAATLAYTLQIYFDFSGYTDMAIGISRMFGFILPANFFSPYKATNISIFWRRWHMSLTRYIRDYVYFPLGGSRVGRWRHLLNLIIVMLLSGLWHGAGWTFILWGALHGVLLAAHTLWRSVRKASVAMRVAFGWKHAISWALTFVSVMVGWVLFRAETVASAVHMLCAMTGAYGIALPGMLKERMGSVGLWLTTHAIVTFDLEKHLILSAGDWLRIVPYMAVLLAIALFLPNTQQILRSFRPVLDQTQDSEPRSIFAYLQWKPSTLCAFFTAILAIFSLIFLILERQTEFLYFRF